MTLTTPNHRRRSQVATLALGLLVGLVACGSDEPAESNSESAASTPLSAPQSTTVATPSIATSTPLADTSAPSTTTTRSTTTVVTPVTATSTPLADTSAPSTTTNRGTATVGDAPTPVITALPADAIADAILSGRLVESDGCLYIADDQSGLRVLVLPYGTTWDAATSSVVDPGGIRVSAGQQVTAQGGESPQINELVPYWLDQAQLAKAQQCGEAAGTTTAVIAGTLTPESR